MGTFFTTRVVRVRPVCWSHHALRTVLGAFAIVSACGTQPTPTKAHVQMPSLPFELPRLLHGASVRQFPCQLICHRASRLVDILFPLSCTVRTQAAPCPGALKFKKQVRSVFSRGIRQRWFHSEMPLAGRVMTCCRVIDCPEKHVCAAGTLHNRGQVVDLFSSGLFLLSIDFPHLDD